MWDVVSLVILVLLEKVTSWAWWYISIVPATRETEEEWLESEELEASLGNINLISIRQKQKPEFKPGVVHAHNPSYREGQGNRRNTSLRLAWAI